MIQIHKNKFLTANILLPQLHGMASVFTTGVFDVVHNGHTRYLRNAGEFGEPLIVGVHSDSFVETRKGKKPIHDQYERIELLSCFDFVDYILLIENQEDLDKVINVINPHTIVVSETTEDEANSPATMKQLYGPRFYIKVLPAQSDEHSSDYIKVK